MEQINLDALSRPFEAGQIKQRKGRGGKMLDYLETHAVIARLNEAFDGAWSFEVADYKTMEGEIVVQGKLTAGGRTKEQFGSSEISRFGSGDKQGQPICIGDDMKSAGSDALKKCATLFGVGLQLYDKSAQPARPPAQPPGPPATGSNGDQERTRQHDAKSATQSQMDFIRELIKSYLFSANERKHIESSIGEKLDRTEASALIDRLKHLIEKRTGEDESAGRTPAHTREDAQAAPDTEATQPGEIDFDREFGGTPPDMPPPHGVKKKHERNIPQEIRLSYSSMVEGMCTALGATNASQGFKNQLLIGIMKEIGISDEAVKKLLDVGGFVHTKGMNAQDCRNLLSSLKTPGAIDRFKPLAVAALRFDKLGMATAKTVDKPDDKPAEPAKTGLPAPEIENPPIDPDSVEKRRQEALRDSVKALQERFQEECGPNGIKLTARILQKHDLGVGGKLDPLNLEAAAEELGGLYRRLSMGEPVEKLLE